MLRASTIIISLVWIAHFAAVSGAQSAISIRVRGVAVGSTEKQVVKRFGRTDVRKGGTFPCDIEGEMRTMKYPGLEFRLIESMAKRGERIVAMIVVSSRKWSVGGIRIGATPAMVRKRFGKARWESMDGRRYLSYFIDDGSGRFFFRRGKLVRIESELNAC